MQTVRKHLYPILCLITCTFQNIYTKQHELSIQKDNKVLRCTFTKGDEVIFDTSIPYTSYKTWSGISIDENTIKQHPHIRYELPDKYASHLGPTLSINIDNPETQLRAEIQLNDVTVNITKLKVYDPFSLKVEGMNAVRARNTLITYNDFSLYAPSTYVQSAISAQWEIGGQATFIVHGATFELNTALRAERDITIEADRIHLPYGQTYRKPGNSYDSYDSESKNFWTCFEYADFKQDPKALIQSKHGDLKLICNRCHIDGGALIAQNDVSINYHQSFILVPHCNKKGYCNLYQEDIGWIRTIIVDKAEEKSALLCDLAVVSAGNNIILTHNGKSCIFNGNAKPCQLGNLTNRGFLLANDHLYSTSDQKNSYIIRNLLPKQPVILPKSAKRITFKECIEKNRIVTEKADENSRFLFIHPLNRYEEELRPLNEFAFSQTGTLTGHEKVLLSVNLQAEALSRVLFETTHTPNLPNFRSNDFIQMINQLHDNGFLFALVQGTLKKVEGDGIQGSHIDSPLVLTDEEKGAYEELLASGNNPLSLTPVNIKDRLSKIKAGTHALTLSNAQINSAPMSFIFLQVDTFNNEKCIVPVLHVTEKDIKENYRLGTMTGRQVIIENATKVVNTGTIQSIDKLRIEAKTIVNAHSRARHFKIHTPLASGQIIGFDVELEVPKEIGSKSSGIYNHGGTIFGNQHLSLITGSGNIENRALLLGTHTFRIDNDTLESLFAQGDQTIDYYPGRFISGGTMTIVAQAGYLLNEASRIIAQSDVHLKGYAGVVLKSLVTHHLTYNGARFNGLTIENIEKESTQLHRSHVQSGGNIYIESRNGKIQDRGGSYKGTDITFTCLKGNEFKPLALDTQTTIHRTGFNPFGFGHVTNTIRSRDFAQTTFDNSGNLHFQSGLDNIFQAVIFTNDHGPIHIVAARDNIFNGARKITDIESDGWSLGVTFFGSQSIQALAHDDLQKAAWHLANEDPLLASLLALKQASSTLDKIAYGTYSTIEALKLFLAYEEQAKSSNHPALRVMGQRLGITDNSGKFNPRMLWRLGTLKVHHNHTQTLQTTIQGKEAFIKSGNQILFLDGTQIKTQQATLQAKHIYAQAAQNTKDHTSSSMGLSVSNDGAFGLDFAYGHAPSHYYKNGYINTGNITIKADSAHFDGFQLSANDADIDVQELTITSRNDESHSRAISGNFLIGTTMTASFAREKSSWSKVANPSGITADNLNLKSKTITLEGSFISSNNSANANIHCQMINHQDIHEYSNTQSLGFGTYDSTQKSDIAGIKGIKDIRSEQESRKGVTRATICQEIKITTNNDISQLNRDMSRLQEILDTTRNIHRIVIPNIDSEKFKEGIKKVRTVLTKNEFITSAQFDQLLEDLGINTLIEANKQDTRETNSPQEEPIPAQETQSAGYTSQPSQSNDREVTPENKEPCSYAYTEKIINDEERIKAQIITLDDQSQQPSQTVAHVEYNDDNTITITYKTSNELIKVEVSKAFFHRFVGEYGSYINGVPQVPGYEAFLQDTERQKREIAELLKTCKFVDEILVKSIPFFGDMKVTYETVTHPEMSLQRKIAILGLLTVPFIPKIGKTVTQKTAQLFNWLKKTRVGSVYNQLAGFLNRGKPGYTTASKIAEVSTKEAAQNIASLYKGVIRETKNGKGWKVMLTQCKEPVIIRVMTTGSGSRTNPYFRVSIADKSSLTLEGKLSQDRLLTHIDLTENYLEKIEHMLNQYGK